MAHNIATINGVSAMAYLGATPWHGLGQRLHGVAGVDQALAAAQLDWLVSLQPMQLASGQLVDGFKAAVRTDADGRQVALGVHGKAYRLIQNTEAAEIMRPLTEDFGCSIEAAGALGNGERCWMLAKLKDATVSPVAGDDVRGYALLDWSHDGQTKLRMLGTPIRVVCQNTLNMAIGAAHGAHWISIRHTASAAQRLDEAAGLVRQLMTALQTTGDTFATLARKVLSAAQLAAYIAQVIPVTTDAKGNPSTVLVNRQASIAALAYNGKGAQLASSLVDTRDGAVSAWAAYNAVTEYFDHVRTAEATNDSGLRRAQESAVFGGNAEIKGSALALAVAA